DLPKALGNGGLHVACTSNRSKGVDFERRRTIISASRKETRDAQKPEPERDRWPCARGRASPAGGWNGTRQPVGERFFRIHRLPEPERRPDEARGRRHSAQAVHWKPDRGSSCEQ